MGSSKIVQSLLAQMGMGAAASTNATMSAASTPPVPEVLLPSSTSGISNSSTIKPPQAASNPLLTSPNGVRAEDSQNVKNESSTGLPRAALTYWIADLKLTPEGEVKILEFGQAMSSAFEGYEALYGINMHTLFYRHVIEQLGLSIWFLPHMGLYHVRGGKEATFRRYALDYLVIDSVGLEVMRRRYRARLIVGNSEREDMNLTQLRSRHIPAW